MRLGREEDWNGQQELTGSVCLYEVELKATYFELIGLSVKPLKQN